MKEFSISIEIIEENIEENNLETKIISTCQYENNIIVN